MYPSGAEYQSLMLLGYLPTASTLTTGAVVSPAGTPSGATLIENGATVEHVLSMSASPVLSLTVGAKTITFFTKLGAAGSARGTKLAILTSDFASSLGVLTEPMGTISVGADTAISGSAFSNFSTAIFAMPNGWYRVVANVTVVSASAMYLNFYLFNVVTGTNYAGDSTSGVQLWGLDIR